MQVELRIALMSVQETSSTQLLWDCKESELRILHDQHLQLNPMITLTQLAKQRHFN